MVLQPVSINEVEALTAEKGKNQKFLVQTTNDQWFACWYSNVFEYGNGREYAEFVDPHLTRHVFAIPPT